MAGSDFVNRTLEYVNAVEYNPPVQIIGKDLLLHIGLELGEDLSLGLEGPDTRFTRLMVTSTYYCGLTKVDLPSIALFSAVNLGDFGNKQIEAARIRLSLPIGATQLLRALNETYQNPQTTLEEFYKRGK